MAVRGYRVGCRKLAREIDGGAAGVAARTDGCHGSTPLVIAPGDLITAAANI